MKQRRKSGFTVIELLVSLFVLSLITIAAASAISTGKQIWARSIKSSENPIPNAEISLLRKIVSSAIDRTLNHELLGSGLSNRLEFAAAYSFDGSLLELSNIQIIADVTHTNIISSSIKSNEKLRNIKLKNIIILNIEYLLYGKDGATSLWSDRWNSGERKPLMIRFKCRNNLSGQIFDVDVLLAH